MLQQAYTPSNTGLQSLVDASADYDLAPIGIGSMREQVDRLAEFGRNGDVYVVHAAEGETVIPMEVLDSNPKVKEMLFAQMRDMGLDPNEFVVGNELNSINPVTGMPEFFFGGIFRAVKKVVKKVFKIVKKIAPIVLPIAAAAFGVPFLPPAFFGAGTFGASFLGSGIGSLIAGDPLPEAFKNGLIGGGLTVLGGGLKASLPGGAGFSEGVSSAFYNPGAATFSQNVSSFGDIFSSDVPGSFGDKTKTFLGVPEAPPADSGISNVDFSTANLTSTPSAVEQAQALNLPMDEAGNFYSGSQIVAGPNVTASGQPLGTGNLMTSQGTFGQQNLGNFVPKDAAEVSTLENLFGSTGKSIDEGMTTAGDYLFRGGESAGAIDQAAKEAGAKYLAETPLALQSAKAFEAAKATARPGMLAKYGPSLALAGVAAKVGGAFEPPKVEKSAEELEAERQRDILRGPNPLYAAAERERELGGKNRFLIGGGDPDALNPNLFRVERATGPGPSGPFQVASQATQPVDFGRAPSYQDYMRNRFGTPFQDNPPYARYAADGGFIDGQPRYPRREMLVEGPGTERSDDIPAMLSDGEFVLNAQSVRGADPTGQGNRYRGAQNLYNMMRNFEMRG